MQKLVNLLIYIYLLINNKKNNVTLHQKIILVTGPRQTGKTTLSKMLENDFDYFNYDNIDDRLSLQEKSWDRSWKTDIIRRQLPQTNT